MARCLSLFAVGGLALHCVADEPSCEDTLTCDTPYLDVDCNWRNADGSRYSGGPLRNVSGLWVWPSGEVSNIQNYVCQQQLAVTTDASLPSSGADGGRPVEEASTLDGGSRVDGGTGTTLLDAGGIGAKDAGVQGVKVLADAAADAGGNVTPPPIVPSPDCLAGQQQRCAGTTDLGLCSYGVQDCVDGSWGACGAAIVPVARDCSSPLDNDCDGLPDNTVDSVCQCVIGTSAACGTHPGLDNVAQCRAGTQICEARSNNTASAYSRCEGSVGPDEGDGCITRGDDTDCNGVPNQGCDCIAAEGNIGCADYAYASLCDPWGYCEPCITSADCSLVTGLPRCAAGECRAALPPPVVTPPVVTPPVVTPPVVTPAVPVSTPVVPVTDPVSAP